MVGRWALEVSAAWPPPSGPGPYPSLGGHIELGCPADRTLERSAMSATRPATAGCPQEELIGGAGLSRRVSGGRTLAERAASLTAAMSGTPWRVLEVPTGRSRVRRRPTSDSGVDACLCHRSGRRRSVEAGGSVGIGKQLPPSALAGRPGALLGGG
jgi:hypothetical protein